MKLIGRKIILQSCKSILHRKLNLLFFALPVEDREEERNDGGAEPEPADIGIVMHAGFSNMVVEQEARYHILQACGSIGEQEKILHENAEDLLGL